MEPCYIIILAAGDSTRLKSRLNKVLHPICGRPMIDYILDSARAVKPRKICLVVGNDRQALQAHLKGQKGLLFAHQKRRLGTGHAAQVGLNALGIAKGEVIVLNGDVPLLTAHTLKLLRKYGPKDPLALVTALLPNPTGYGRILRDPQGKLTGIVEERNATPAQREINEVNAGVYRAEVSFLKQMLTRIKKNPIKKEYYLTAIVGLAAAEGMPIHALSVADAQEILGANTRAELAYLNHRVRAALVRNHLAQGVGMEDPDSVNIDYWVRIGEDSLLGPGVQLLGATRLGRGNKIEVGCVVRDSRIGDDVNLKAYSYLEDCDIGTGAVVGPFARIRPGSRIGKEARVGNFVEIKKTVLGEGSKANHLTYLGDSRIGKKVNIGAGTITCNYDGRHKFPTVIEDGAFIGSDTQLVAPVKVGKGAYVGAGSTLTRNVPPAALAISRVPQRNIRGFIRKKKK